MPQRRKYRLWVSVAGQVDNNMGYSTAWRRSEQRAMGDFVRIRMKDDPTVTAVHIQADGGVNGMVAWERPLWRKPRHE